MFNNVRSLLSLAKFQWLEEDCVVFSIKILFNTRQYNRHKRKIVNIIYRKINDLSFYQLRINYLVIFFYFLLSN